MKEGDQAGQYVIDTFLLQVGQVRKFGLESRRGFDRERLLRLCVSGEEKVVLLNCITSEVEKSFVCLVVALVLTSIELKHSNEKDHAGNTLSHSILLPCLSNLH